MKAACNKPVTEIDPEARFTDNTVFGTKVQVPGVPSTTTRGIQDWHVVDGRTGKPASRTMITVQSLLVREDLEKDTNEHEHSW